MRNRFLLLGLLFVLISNVASAQTQDGFLKGTVTDKKTGEALAFANLRLLMNGVPKIQGQTDENGKYRLGPVSPGSYTLQVKYIGYPDLQVEGVIIIGDKTVEFNVKMGGADTSVGVKLKETVIVHYDSPIFQKDQNTTGSTFTSGDMKNSPIHTVSGFISTASGAVSASDGLHINGARSSSNVYYIDGVKTYGAPNLPKEAIEQISILTGGIPAEYGDATGGVTTITTKGPSSNYMGSLEGITSELLDPYGYNLVDGTLSGPLYKKYKKTDSARTILGFFISGNALIQKVSNPPAIPIYQVNDDVLEQIKQNPLRESPLGSGFVSNAEFVTKDQMHTTRVIPNNGSQNYSFTGKLDFQPAPMLNLTAGTTIEYSNGRSYNFANIMFNNEYNTQSISSSYRGFLRLRQYFNTGKNSAIKGAYYTIQADYSQYNGLSQDADLKGDLWKYGYLGKFDVTRTPLYLYTTDTIDGKLVTSNYLQGYYYNGMSFTPSDINPITANYTSNYFNQAGEVLNYSQLQSGGGLLNGQSPPYVYSLWTNVGTRTTGYGKSQTEQYSLNASGAATIKGHEIKFGITYEQRMYRAYSISASGLWGLARQLTNKHLTQLDLTNPIPLYDQNGNFKDTVVYNYQVAPGEQANFDKNLRERLRQLGEKGDDGKEINDQTWINIDKYDPSVFNVNMFSANELLNDGNSYINYYGYDYLGNKLSRKPSIEDFLDPSKRSIGAYNPIYTAGYIQDRFEYRDLIFRVGLRVDRFDANQLVLKDPYSLYPVRTVGEVSSINNTPVTHPGNIGSDYAVYVDDALNPTRIVGYRNGSTWYDASGAEVVDPHILELETKTGTIQPYLTARNEDEVQLSRESFKDYEPQLNFMPRISFSFPISENSNFYANYDVLTQRPLTGNLSTFDDYYYLMKRSTITIPNPALKPEKRINYELGFKQIVSKQSALSLRAFYSEIRDMIQSVQINQAYPTTYTTLSNIDFGTVKGLTFGYDLKRLPAQPNGLYSSGVSITSNYTIQFASGTGSNAASGAGLIASGYPNLRTPFPLDYDVRHVINFIVDYRFGFGAGYSGPMALKGLLEESGINLQLSTRSGTPYTRQSNVTSTALFGVAQRSSMVGTINGSRLPWQFIANLQVDKDIALGMGKKKDGTLRNPLYMNVYVWVQNLLNSKNVVYVYRYTGLPNDDGFLNSAEGQKTLETAVSSQAMYDQYSAKMNNPGNYIQPRLIRVGASINF